MVALPGGQRGQGAHRPLRAGLRDGALCGGEAPVPGGGVGCWGFAGVGGGLGGLGGGGVLGGGGFGGEFWCVCVCARVGELGVFWALAIGGLLGALVGVVGTFCSTSWCPYLVIAWLTKGNRREGRISWDDFVEGPFQFRRRLSANDSPGSPLTPFWLGKPNARHPWEASWAYDS